MGIKITDTSKQKDEIYMQAKKKDVMKMKILGGNNLK